LKAYQVQKPIQKFTLYLGLNSHLLNKPFLLISRDDLHQINDKNVVNVKFLQKITVRIILVIVKGVDRIKRTEWIK